MHEGKPGSFLSIFKNRLTKTIISGAQNLSAIDAPGPAMLIMNHTTVVDVIVTLGSLHELGYTADGPCHGKCSHKRHIRPIGTADLWNFKFTRKRVEGSGVIATDQHDGRSAFRNALRALDDNQCVLIYPEGDVKINEEASPREWRPGAVALARSRQMPIVPIAHHDCRKLGSGSVAKSIISALSKVAWKRPTIHLNIGRPILPAELEGKSPTEIGQIMFDRLVETWQVAKAAN